MRQICDFFYPTVTCDQNPTLLSNIIIHVYEYSIEKKQSIVICFCLSFKNKNIVNDFQAYFNNKYTFEIMYGSLWFITKDKIKFFMSIAYDFIVIYNL